MKAESRDGGNEDAWKHGMELSAFYEVDGDGQAGEAVYLPRCAFFGRV